jgi:hypothetical protein
MEFVLLDLLLERFGLSRLLEYLLIVGFACSTM